MQNYSLDQSEADTVLFSDYAVLRESGYCGPVVIDAADKDAYVTKAVTSQQLSNVLCSYMTRCDANSGFYGKGKKSVCDQVAKSPVARRQLSRCGESLDLEEEVVTRHVIYGDNKSNTIAETRAARWKRMKNKSCIRFPPDADSLRQYCLRANYLAYLMRHPSLRDHPSPLRHGLELLGGPCRLVRHTGPALPTYLPAPGPAEESGEDDSEDEEGVEADDDIQKRRGI